MAGKKVAVRTLRRARARLREELHARPHALFVKRVRNPEDLVAALEILNACIRKIFEG
jgi:hypothetical protein